MSIYDDTCKKMGYEPYANAPIKLEHKYRAYANGTFTVHDTQAEAKKVSSLVELFAPNQDACDAYWEARQKVASKVTEAWFNELKEYWITPVQALSIGLSEDLFNVCYAEAYDRGHSAGYAEVENYMHSVVDFALKVKMAK